MSTLRLTTVRGGSISFWSYLADGKEDTSTPLSPAAQIPQFISNCFIGSSGWQGWLCPAAGWGAHVDTLGSPWGSESQQWGGGNSQAGGEEEQLQCLQPRQLCAKCVTETCPFLLQRLRKTLLSFHRNGNPSLSVQFDWCHIEMNFKANSQRNC